MITPLAQNLLSWYQEHARSLPWRGHVSPYAVWVSEIMLQQTRVETVIPYFERWMKRFPSLALLAEASEEDVLHAWEGLGYYRRVLALHKAARMVMEQYAGTLPSDPRELKELPGIGAYTAAAIAAIAFGKDVIALDGNLKRVFARLLALEQSVKTPAGERMLHDAALKNLPAGQAGVYNQALMDLGAVVCMPRNPRCSDCPIQTGCRAFALSRQEDFPVLPARPAIPHYQVTAAVIQHGRSVLIARRPPNGLLGGLWEFPGGKQEPGETLPGCLKREIREELGIEIAVGEPFGVYRHAYTHFKVTLHAFLCTILSGEPAPLEASELRWIEMEDLATVPMGKLDRAISRRLSPSATIK